MNKNNIDMLSGSVFKGLLAMTLPIMLMNVMQTLFSAIDMAILGQFVNDIAVGAVGVCGTLISLCTGLLVGTSIGANVVIAKYIGKGDKEHIERAVGCAILFSVVGGIVLAIIGISCAEIFLKWTNCPAELLNQAVLYFKIYFAGVPVILFYSFCASILRSVGDTKRSMFFSLAGGVAKILLSLFFIIVLKLGVAGVALTTIISNLISGVLCFLVIVRSKDTLHFNPKKMKFYGSELKQMLYIGIPTGIQTALYSLANTVIVTAVNSFGADATTGLSVANQFDGILYYIIHAPSLAVMPYVAQNIGAKNIKRAKEAIYKGVIITIIFGATLGSLSAIFSKELSSIMSSTPAVIMYSQQKMIIVSSSYFICGINEVMSATLRGIGKPVVPTVSALIFMCVLRLIWVKYIFPLLPASLTFLYLVWPIGWILCIITALIFILPTIKKLQEKFSNPETINV